MAVGQVVSIEINKEFPTKSGGTYTAHELVWVTDKGKRDTKRISDRDCANAGTTLGTFAAGDTIEVTSKKDGNFWNVIGLKLISKGTGEAPVAAKKSWGSTDDPNKQLYIIRQNSLQHATNLVCAELAAGRIPKEISSTGLSNAIIKLASKFELHVYGKLESEIGQTDESTGSTTEIPF